MQYGIGETLKKYRNTKNISVKQISDILIQNGFKASESTIYSWENDNSQPTPRALLLMCRVYGIKNILESFGYNSIKESENAVIGSQENVVFNISNSLNDIEHVIKQLPSQDQIEAEKLLEELKTTQYSNHPILIEGALSKFSNLLKKHSDLFIAVGGWAVQLLIGK